MSEKKTVKDVLLKDAIITGIISSIIFTFLLQPVFKVGWDYLNESGSKIITKFNDQVYSGRCIILSVIS